MVSSRSKPAHHFGSRLRYHPLRHPPCSLGRSGLFVGVFLSAFLRVVAEPTLTGSAAAQKAGARLVVAGFRRWCWACENVAARKLGTSNRGAVVAVVRLALLSGSLEWFAPRYPLARSSSSPPPLKLARHPVVCLASPLRLPASATTELWVRCHLALPSRDPLVQLATRPPVLASSTVPASVFAARPWPRRLQASATHFAISVLNAHVPLRRSAHPTLAPLFGTPSPPAPGLLSSPLRPSGAQGIARCSISCAARFGSIIACASRC